MRAVSAIAFFCFISYSSQGQACSEILIINSDTIILDPEKHAYPEDGFELYRAWMSNNMNDTLRTNSDEPRKVFVSFVINELGAVSNLEVIKGVGKPYDDEAIHLIKIHPHKWIPGRCGERNLKTKVVIPVWF